MSVFQETIWALWIIYGRHLQTSIKYVDMLSGVLLTRVKNWSNLIELQGPEPLYNLLLCCSALTEAAEPNSCLENTPSSCPWLCNVAIALHPKWMMCRICPHNCYWSSLGQAPPGICGYTWNATGSACRVLPCHKPGTPAAKCSGLSYPHPDEGMASGTSCTLASPPPICSSSSS